MSLELGAQEIPDHPRDWVVALEGYLSQNDVVCDKATPINGGISCFLWRLDGLKDAEASSNGHQEGEAVVMKCADSMAKMAPVKLNMSWSLSECITDSGPFLGPSCRGPNAS